MATKTKPPKTVTGTPESPITAGAEHIGKAVGSMQPTTQYDINQILQPYMNELMNIGPEYGAEMQYLAPYLSPDHQQQTFSGLQAQSQANESPTGDKGLAAAEQASNNAILNEQPPGFGQAATAAKQYEQSIPYSQVLQDVLAAGKNEILGYSTVPNLTNINTQGWPDALKGVVPYLEKSIGYNPNGTPSLQTTQIQSQSQPGGSSTPAPATNPSVTPQVTSYGGLQGGGSGS